VFFWPAVTQQGVFFLGDTSHHYVPRLAYTGEAFRSARLPLWNPRLGLGQPHIGDPAALALYPPGVLLFTLLPAPAALNLMVLGHVLLAALGTAAYTRALGLSPPGAALAAVCFAFGGWMLTHTEHVNVLVGAAFLPVFLWRTEAALAASGRRALASEAIVTALITAPYLLGAHPQMAVYACLGIAVYGAVRAALLRPPGATFRALCPRLFALAAGAVLGAGLAAIQLLPMAEAIALSNRGIALEPDVALAYSYPPEQLVTLVAPNYFGQEPGFAPWGRGAYREMTLYVGLLPLALSGFGVASARHDPRARLLLLLFGLGLVLAMGSFTPLYPALARLPPLRLARFPVRFLAFSALGLAGLAGLGLDDWTRRAENYRSRVRWLARAALVVLAGVLAVNLVLWRPATALRVTAWLLRALYPTAEDEPEWWTYAADQIFGLDHLPGFGLAFFLGAFVLLAAAWRRGRLSRTAFFAAVFATAISNLWLFSRTLARLATTEPRLYTQPSLTAARMQRESAGARMMFFMVSDSEEYRRRIVLPNRKARYLNYETLLREGLRGAFASLFGLRTLEATALTPPSQIDLLRQLGGYQPYDLAGKGQERRELNVSLLSRLGGDYVTALAPLSDPRLRLLQDGAIVKLYRNEAALPRAYVASGFEVVPDEATRLARLAAEDADPRVALLEESPGFLPGPAVSAETAIASDAPEDVAVDTRLSAAGILVLSDAFYPGWGVEVDGAPRPLLRVNHGVRGVALAAGRHRVRFRYRARMVVLGAEAGLLSLAGLLAIGLAARRDDPPAKT
jgi:hypothetical protein